MKKRFIIIGIITALLAGTIIFAVVNRKAIFDNFVTLFAETLMPGELAPDDVHYTDCGNYKFDFVVRRNDNYLVRMNRPYYDNPELPKIIGGIYQYEWNDLNFYGISEYGYIFVSKEGVMCINLNEKGKDIGKVDAPDIIYLSSFDEFSKDTQERLKYLDEKIIVKRGAYSIWN